MPLHYTGKAMFLMSDVTIQQVIDWSHCMFASQLLVRVARPSFGGKENVD